ncbi:hypothetical protein [Geobacter argillaceus]|uniref:Uncharacterized protein n=1 Tax=Geobacter argillaceus TaxID=345631 RepID=A0A562W859_9BACT|nr:hypothetical protein [Geobacter argillaceus]TWJ26416.1 hypothetical protein JN12_01122 [Geobacter argillaceus]
MKRKDATAQGRKENFKGFFCVLATLCLCVTGLYSSIADASLELLP